MTREEAIKHPKWFSEYNEDEYCGGDRIQKGGDWYYYINKEDFEAFDMAIKALEQDTPKKVNIEQWIPTECPNGCGHILSTHHGDGYYSIDDKPTFCPLCGQRLDWGDE